MDAAGDLSTPRSIIVIGNGMVGHRFCEEPAEREEQRRYRFVVFGEEPRPAYDRAQLSSYFEGRSAEGLSITSLDGYADQGFEIFVGDPVVEIDRAACRVVSGAFTGLLLGDCLLSWIEWGLMSGALDGFWQTVSGA